MLYSNVKMVYGMLCTIGPLLYAVMVNSMLYSTFGACLRLLTRLPAS